MLLLSWLLAGCARDLEPYAECVDLYDALCSCGDTSADGTPEGYCLAEDDLEAICQADEEEHAAAVSSGNATLAAQAEARLAWLDCYGAALEHTCDPDVAEAACR